MSYAKTTTVPVERTRAEIERTLQRYGASGFGWSWERHEGRDEVMVGFKIGEHQVRLSIPMPSEAEIGSQVRTAQATRARWRAILLVIKAKLEAVEAGISTIEAEFLANVVTADGRTVGEIILPRLSEAVEKGRLLPARSE